MSGGNFRGEVGRRGVVEGVGGLLILRHSRRLSKNQIGPDMNFWEFFFGDVTALSLLSLETFHYFSAASVCPSAGPPFKLRHGMK